MHDTYLNIPEPIGLDVAQDAVVLCFIPANSSSEGREMLSKIFLACGLTSPQQSMVVEVAKPCSAVAELSSIKGLPFVVSFGLSPKQLGSQWVVNAYSWVSVKDRKYCFAERLEKISEDGAKKKMLWACMKDIKVHVSE